MDSQKSATYSYDRSDNVEHHDIIQVLHPIRKYYFDDACICFTNDADSYPFIQRLLKLPTIQYEVTYNLKKMTVDHMIAHVTQLLLHEAQKKKKVGEEVVVVAKKDVVASIQAEASTEVVGVTPLYMGSSLILQTLVSWTKLLRHPMQLWLMKLNTTF